MVELALDQRQRDSLVGTRNLVDAATRAGVGRSVQKPDHRLPVGDEPERTCGSRQ
jgi:hypothetical protein